ncbi:MAG: response regulator [Pseudomonadota bacterium]
MAAQRIIVADDSITVQKVMKLILSPKNYDVECYNNGKDALDAVKKNKPILVFADVMMPEMNGVDLGAALKKSQKGSANVPIVLLYSTFDNVTSADYARSGAMSKIAKPFDDSQIIEAVEKFGLSETEADGKEEKGSWDMGHFVEPEVPNLTLGDGKLPLPDEEGFFNIDANVDIPELGIPEPEEMKTFKEKKGAQKTAQPSPPAFNITVTETEPLSEETLSEEEAEKLLNEFKLKENPDGTINFNEITPEKDMGLWGQKYYSGDEETEVPFNADAQHDPKEITGEDIDNIHKITRETVERIVKKMLPDIAERILREEISKLVGKD